MKDFWDQLEVMAKVAGAIAVPIVIGVVGLLINSSLKSREIQAEYVSLAVGLLQNADTTAAYRPIRKYAVTILQNYSPVEMPTELGELLETRRLAIAVKEAGQVIVSSAPPAPEGLHVADIGPHSVTVEIEPYTYHAADGFLWLYRLPGDSTWAAQGGSDTDLTRYEFLALTPSTTFELTVFAYDKDTGLNSGLSPSVLARTTALEENQ